MDAKLIAWAHAQACRRNWLHGVPPLWLFTDERRLPDPRRAIACLPKGRAGVVLRHDQDPGREALGRDIARLCRVRRLSLVVAGDPRLAAKLHAGQHLRGGRRVLAASGLSRRRASLITSSAHDGAELRRAGRAGADLAFLSPAFVTPSHPGASALGPSRWARLANRAVSRLAVAALGGINGMSVRRLPRHTCRAVGAIEALSPAQR